MEKTGSGFYIIDAFSLRQASKKPFHLEKRFLNSGDNDINSLEEAEIKREALLQERREKLSRKFLEVQQVVKQAQARKESQRQVFQQSLQLAELKRKTHIEQRRAASKELVERAKVIARQNSLRFEAEQARQRRALQDRLERSEARRLHMLSQPKSRILVTGTSSIASSSASHSRKKKNKSSGTTTAASTTRCIIGVVTETSSDGDGATLSRNVKAGVDIKKGTCDQHAASKHQSVMGTTKKKKGDTWKHVRSAFYKLSLPWSSQASTWIPFNELVVLLRNRRVILVIAKLLRILLNVTDKDKSRKWSRVLLSAYMMTICPCEVFQDMQAQQEQQLLAQAKQFLRQFELVLESHPEVTPGSTTRSHFEESWNAYYALFEAWKTKDMKQLVANMSSYCIELIRLKETLGQDDDTVRQQLDEQIQQTKDRIRHVGGPSALEQLVESEHTITSSSSSKPTSSTDQQQPLSVPPSPTPRPERLESKHQEQQPMADDELKQMLSGYTHEGGITNHQLAHEIIIDPEFKLQKQSSALEDHIRQIATRAFFDRVAQDINEGHSEESLPMLMDDVKQRLLNLLRKGSSVYNQVDEGIDIGLITQQAKQNSFDLDQTLQHVVHIMSQICAPVRDEAIRAMGDMDDPVQRLRAILEMLDEMALDLSNYRLRSLRPHLIPIAVEYERSKFAESLANHTVGLARARAWLQQAVRRMNEVAMQRNPEGVPTPTPTLRADAVFEDAFITLLTSPQIMDATTCPETLAMDVDRMRVYQNEMQSITIVAALVMLAKNFGHVGDLNDLTKKLFIMLQDRSTTIDNLASEIERTVRISPERKPMIRAMVDKTVSHSDTVYSLLMRRVGSVIRGQLQSGKFATREVLLSYGLEYVRKPLESLSTRVAILGRHHRQVYATWYDDIIADEIKAIS